MRSTEFSRMVIYGAGGLGREVLQAVRDMRAAGAVIDCIGFLVDPLFESADVVNGIPVRRRIADFAGDDGIGFLIAVGNPAVRARIARRVEREAGPRFATVIHPRTSIGNSVSIGSGTVVLAFASVTADAHIGHHVLINPAVTIAHDCVLGDFASLAPAVALAGHVTLGEGCKLGIGARLAPGVRAGRWSMVGAGAVVLDTVPENSTVVGVPARTIKTREAGWERDA